MASVMCWKRADSRYLAQAEHLAMRLRLLRERAALTQEQAASRAGISVATLRKIEKSAVVEPGYFTVMALMAALGATPTDLAS
jgi:transcriptional regulator with XRE-family HTH domain